MSEDTYTFDQARLRLEEIAKQAKGASLEKCLDLLEEGVKLANVCTEKIDHTRWRDEVGTEVEGEDGAAPDAVGDGPAADAATEAASDDAEPAESAAGSDAAAEADSDASDSEEATSQAGGASGDGGESADEGDEAQESAG